MSHYKPDSARTWRGKSYKKGGETVASLRDKANTDKSERPAGPKLDSMCELLLTILALAQESYNGPLSHAVPKRLASALRRARKSELVHLDHHGIYLEEMGSAYLDDALGTSTPFTCNP